MTDEFITTLGEIAEDKSESMAEASNQAREALTEEYERLREEGKKPQSGNGWIEVAKNLIKCRSKELQEAV